MIRQEEMDPAVQVVGCSVEICSQEGRKTIRQEATITGYDPSTNQHRIKLEKDGKESERTVDLTKTTCKISCAKPEPVAPMKAKDPLSLVIQREAVGRELEIYSPKFNKYYRGKIIEFVEELKKHKILFDKGSQTKLVKLQKHKWQFTDFVKGKRVCNKHTLATSKYIGVRRSSPDAWRVSAPLGKRKLMTFSGCFATEQEAALAYDVYARRAGRPTNFPPGEQQQWTEADIEKHQSMRRKGFTPKVRGVSKFHGVVWHQNRWRAQYHPRQGECVGRQKRRQISLGAFLQERQAALAFDAEARKFGRPDSHLNFPKEIVSDEQISAWKEASYRCCCYFNAQSKYRGVYKSKGKFAVSMNIQKVLFAEGKQTTQHLGTFKSEIAAALEWDRTCRKHGIEESKLNFPRNTRLAEVRLFDDECYSCFEENPSSPLATPCNHVFCADCVKDLWIKSAEPKCPCCHTPIPPMDNLRPITLIPREKATRRIKEEQSSEIKKEETESPTKGNRRYRTRRTSGGEKKDYSVKPRYPIGTEFSRTFLEGNYKGVVTSFDGKKYTVRYEDGDVMIMSEDDFDHNDVNLYDEVCNQNISNPKYPIGTKFVKDFNGLGKFEGEIISYSSNGWYYRVFYPRDGDKEDLSDYDFDGSGTIEILSMPKSENDNEKQSTTTARQPSRTRKRLKSENKGDEYAVI